MKDDQRPGYLRIADDLRHKILSGEHPVGSNIPSTADLMTIYAASSTVVRAAVNELRIEGTVRGHPGKGVEVQRLPNADLDGAGDEVMAALESIRADLAALNGRLARVEDAVLGDEKPPTRKRGPQTE